MILPRTSCITTPAGACKTQVREVKAGSGYLGQSDRRVHFGLGDAARIDSIEIRWPSGMTEIVRNVPVNHIVTIVAGEGLRERGAFATNLGARPRRGLAAGPAAK
jgi:hypothetical protein